MALIIDSRLLEPNGEGEIVENFNRILHEVDENSLPEVESTDEGKVLVVNEEGEWEPGSVDALPEVSSSDAGKALVVNSDGEWEVNMVDGLPSVTSSDEVKFLVVDSNGAWVAATVPVADNMSF